MPALILTETGVVLGAAAATVTTILALLGIAGVAYKRGLLPNLLRDMKPDLDEVKTLAREARDRAAEARTTAAQARDAAGEALRQVSVNGHASETNTLKDDVTDVRTQVQQIRRRQRLMGQKLRIHLEHHAADAHMQSALVAAQTATPGGD